MLGLSMVVRLNGRASCASRSPPSLKVEVLWVKTSSGEVEREVVEEKLLSCLRLRAKS